MCVGAGAVDGAVGGDQYTGGGRGRVEEAERGERAAVGEETASCAEHQRMHGEHVLVDEVVAHERLDEGPAAEDVQVSAWTRLEVAAGAGDVALQQCGVRPGNRVVQGGRRNVLGGAVQRAGDRAVELGI